MTVYVPGTLETDPKKIIMSLQQMGPKIDTNEANIATNTANIATNTANIATLLSRSLTNAVLVATPSNPTGTASGTALMMGLGSTCKITPVYSTRVYVNLYGGATQTGGTSAGTGVQVQVGTGTAPTNAAALTGSTMGSGVVFTTTSGQTVPWSITGILTGLTVGVQIWIDIGLKNNGSGPVASLNSITCTAMEF